MRPRRRTLTSTSAGCASFTRVVLPGFTLRAIFPGALVEVISLALRLPTRRDLDPGRPGQVALNAPESVWVARSRRGSSSSDATGASTFGLLVVQIRAGVGRFSFGVEVGSLRCATATAPNGHEPEQRRGQRHEPHAAAQTVPVASASRMNIAAGGTIQRPYDQSRRAEQARRCLRVGVAQLERLDLGRVVEDGLLAERLELEVLAALDRCSGPRS